MDKQKGAEVGMRVGLSGVSLDAVPPKISKGRLCEITEDFYFPLYIFSAFSFFSPAFSTFYM